MRVTVPRERAARERRIAATPQSVSTMRSWGWSVGVETGAGEEAGFPDRAFTDVEADILPDAAAAHGGDIVLRIGPPSVDEIGLCNPDSILAGFLDPFVAADLVAAARDRHVTTLAMEAIPRITLAQSMDALSSQATVAGYAAVLLAAAATPKFLPMLTTAAGTIPPARTLILGVGVAGLQAIATARRLGAVVYAYDIRTETREQVESLGARFVAAPTTEADEGGYAREVGEDVQEQQHRALAPQVAKADVIITTAQIPGRPAPRLVTADMIGTMHPGAVIVDMATSTGGNVEGSVPDEVVRAGDVTIYGPTDLASRVPTDASRMYARNLVTLLDRIRNDEGAVIDLDDDVIGGCAITHQGEVVHPRARQLLGLEQLV